MEDSNLPRKQKGQCPVSVHWHSREMLVAMWSIQRQALDAGHPDTSYPCRKSGLGQQPCPLDWAVSPCPMVRKRTSSMTIHPGHTQLHLILEAKEDRACLVLAWIYLVSGFWTWIHDAWDSWFCLPEFPVFKQVSISQLYWFSTVTIESYNKLVV